MKTLTTLILRRPSRNQHMQKPSLKSNSYFFSSNRHQNFLRGCTRLALNSTPFLQDFKLLRRCAEIKSKFAFFQEQRETVDVFGNHGLGGLLKEGAHEKSPKCLGGNLGDFGEFCKGFRFSNTVFPCKTIGAPVSSDTKVNTPSKFS